MLDDLDGPGPECPVCGRPLAAVGEDELLHWWCLTCGVLRPSDGGGDPRQRIRLGDLVAERRSGGRFDVGIGGIAHLGDVHRGLGTWVATRRPDRFGRSGTLYVERGLPEVLGVANSLEEALGFYAPPAEP